MGSKLRLGVGGPVGSGKTALVEALCRRLRDQLQLAVFTNDIYTQEDAQFLTHAGALEPSRIRGVETGGCPHTAIREDCSINRAAVAELEAQFPALDLVLVESGGDNLAASFSPELVDLCIYVIDVAAGDKIPRKGGRMGSPATAATYGSRYTHPGFGIRSWTNRSNDRSSSDRKRLHGDTTASLWPPIKPTDAGSN